jgi:hypothetical protein
MRLRWIKLLALFALGSLHAPVGAVPPPSAAMTAATMGFDPFAPDPADVAPVKEAPLPIVHVPDTARSAGSAIHGRLVHGIQLPENDSLYTIRNPDNTWASSHAIEQLQLAIASFRRGYGFVRELVIEDMSQHHGGRFPPHHSHRSGRDVDVELPLKDGIAVGTLPLEPAVVNWDATWALVRAFIDTGEVRYIFLSRSRQVELYNAAKRAGVSASELEEYIQYPNHGLTTFVRHSHGHDKHMHVRFKCASYETDCSD